MDGLTGPEIKLADHEQLIKAVKHSVEQLGATSPLEGKVLGDCLHVVRVMLAMHNVEDRTKPVHHMCELMICVNDSDEPFVAHLDLLAEDYDALPNVPEEILFYATQWADSGDGHV